MTKLDLTFVRRQFPAFGEPTLKGWGFFENAGGSYTCKQVIRLLNEYYTKTKVQPYHRYPAAISAGNCMDESYVRLADYLNVEQEEIVFGPSTSQNLYVLAKAFREIWSEGDEIILSNQDHEANSGFWRRLEQTGIVVKEWQVDPQTGVLNPGDLDALLSEKTKLVAFPHCSNIVGHVNPVSEIVSKAKKTEARVVVDGVAHAPHGLPDVGSLGADIYLFSLYKTWGPHLGIMTIKKDLLESLPNQGHYFNAGDRRKKLLPAGPDHAQIASAAGVAEYLDDLFKHHYPDPADCSEKARRIKNLFFQHEQKLLSKLMDWFRNRSDVRVIGPTDPASRVPTLSILPLNKSVERVHAKLTGRKLMTGMGHFYGVRPLLGMKVPIETGVIRLSFIHYTIEDEIDQLINGLSVALD